MNRNPELRISSAISKLSFNPINELVESTATAPLMTECLAEDSERDAAYCQELLSMARGTDVSLI
jgi:hypothetical protein